VLAGLRSFNKRKVCALSSPENKPYKALMPMAACTLCRCSGAVALSMPTTNLQMNQQPLQQGLALVRGQPGEEAVGVHEDDGAYRFKNNAICSAALGG
jgi:hypothetical protein